MIGFTYAAMRLFPSWRGSPFKGQNQEVTILGFENMEAVILNGNNSFTGYVTDANRDVLSGSDVSMWRFIAHRRNLRAK
jgi:hypothetical protein